MNELLQRRREYSTNRLQELRDHLGKAQELVGEKGCIYVTGSFARGEASDFSDLDLFILSDCSTGKREISRLDEIQIFAELIEIVQQLRFPPFSNDGEFLKLITIEELCKNIGRPNDDYVNTFTARLLLLLESKVLFDSTFYQVSIRRVIDSYWRDFDDNKDGFIPGFLVNDILRMWRTFCVNYEAISEMTPDLQKADPESKPKRKLKNYKLKHSRLLTCFSAIAFLLVAFNRNKTVTPNDAIEMVKLSPTERLEFVKENFSSDQELCRIIDDAVNHYSNFLHETSKDRQTLLTLFKDKAKVKALNHFAFGDAIHEILKMIGQNSLMYRIITV